jgi:hypothetical protein
MAAPNPVSRNSISIARTMKIARACPWVLLLMLYNLGVCCFAAEATTVSSFRDPKELVRKTIQNEIKADKNGNGFFFYRGVKTTPKDSTTRLFVETKEATAGMLIAYNGKPLTPQQRQAEEERIQRFVNHPEELKKRREQQREDDEHETRIMRAIPDAFLFDYDGEQPATDHIGHLGDRLVKLSFRPNPNYQPPSRVEEVLTGMKGYLLIDPVRFRLATIDGTLFKEVAFGWGILGHLNSGSRFIVQQQYVGDNDWEVSNMTLDFTGKILLVKNLSIKSIETYSDFRPVPPNLTFAQAVDLLKKEQASTTTADNCCQSQPVVK